VFYTFSKKGYKINQTFKSNKLPFLELTYNKDINGCPKSHIHNKLTIVAVESGSIVLHLKNSELILKEKNIAVINPNQIHSATKVDKYSYGIYAFYLDKVWVQKLQNNLFKNDEYMPFTDNIITVKQTYTNFLSLCKTIFFNDFTIKKEELIIDFISNLMIDSSNEAITKPKNILACDIKAYIDKHITSNLTIEEISKEFLISPFHLIRVFKKELDLTPYQYILNQKVNLAKDLLSKGINIAEVAIIVGFNDQSHLYKYFKQIFSVSPKEYQVSLTH
jgi:AraC-like DNA-binding protein